MSNARMFCIGAFIGYLVCLVIKVVVGTDHSDLIDLAAQALLALNFGITAVALFGDRDRRKRRDNA